MSIKLIDVKKSFGTPPTDVLKGISLEINDGDFVSIVGRSGSGKSTLLYIMSSLDNASSGKILYNQTDLVQMNQKEIHELRNTKIGFVFQFHYLLPELTVLENVLMPARKHNLQSTLKLRAIELIKEVDLEGKEHRMPSQLSGGEQQRVAIARALLMTPQYLFADEPTGNLDSHNGDRIMALFQKINQEKKTTVIYVTHDKEFANRALKKIELADGSLKNI
jgi:putative ABC transport system ATP-binding protein/lipoprotein-releasing system ATP-binding protein